MYKTDSLDEAAYLVSEGFTLRKSTPPEPGSRLVVFWFDETSDLQDSVLAWRNRYVEPTLTDAARFANARIDLFRRVKAVLR